MPGIRVTADGAGMGAALLPVPAADAMGYQSWGEVRGELCVGIPAPYPAAVYQDRSHRALHRSSDAPPEWRPEPYYQPVPATRFGGSTDSDNQMPMPAVPPNGKPAVMARTPVFLRQRQVGWPLATPSYSWTRG